MWVGEAFLFSGCRTKSIFADARFVGHVLVVAINKNERLSRRRCFHSFMNWLGMVYNTRNDGSCAGCRSPSARSVSDTFGTGTASLRCATAYAPSGGACVWKLSGTCHTGTAVDLRLEIDGLERCLLSCRTSSRHTTRVVSNNRLVIDKFCLPECSYLWRVKELSLEKLLSHWSQE